MLLAERKKVNKDVDKEDYLRYLEKGYVTSKHNPITNPFKYHI